MTDKGKPENMSSKDRQALAYLVSQKKFNMTEDLPRAKSKKEIKVMKNTKNDRPENN